MSRNTPVKPVPATVHGQGVRLQYYLISALRGVNPLKDLLSAKRLCHRIARQDGFAVFRHWLHVQLVRHCELREPEMSTGRGRGAEKWISTL